MCMRQTAALPSDSASMAPGARKALMSLIIEAPAAIAARITPGLRVSTEIGTPRASQDTRIFSSQGMTRASSSASGVGAAESEEVGALVQHLPNAIGRVTQLEKGAAVGKRVGGYVEDAHDQGAVE